MQYWMFKTFLFFLKKRSRSDLLPFYTKVLYSAEIILSVSVLEEENWRIPSELERRPSFIMCE
jgi:hypothetical protein